MLDLSVKYTVCKLYKAQFHRSCAITVNRKCSAILKYMVLFSQIICQTPYIPQALVQKNFVDLDCSLISLHCFPTAV